MTPIYNKDGEIPYNGNMEYEASNGYNIKVFVDCGEFDYIHSFDNPFLLKETYNVFEEDSKLLQEYVPDEKTIKEVYKLK